MACGLNNGTNRKGVKVNQNRVIDDVLKYGEMVFYGNTSYSLRSDISVAQSSLACTKFLYTLRH